MAMDRHRTPGRNLSVWLLVLGLLGAAMGFCLSAKDYVATSVAAVTALGGLWGDYMGAVRLVGALVALVAAYEFSTPAARCLLPQIADRFGTAPGTTWLLSLGISGLVIAMLVTLVMELFSRWLTRDRQGFDAGNRFVGFGVGAAEAVLVMLLLLSTLSSLWLPK